MSDHEASHLPVTTRLPHALGICLGCRSGTCRPVAGVYVLFVELLSDVALALALERPELRLRKSYHTIYRANPHIVRLVTQVMVEERGKRTTAHDHAREARLQSDSGNKVASEEVQTTAVASQKVEPSKHIRDLTSPIAVAANAAIKEALIAACTSGYSSQSSPEQGRTAPLSPPPQPLYATSAPVKTKRVRRTVPKRLARRPAPHISISHPSVLHVPENITTHATPLDKSNLREGNAYGNSSLMANNSLPPNPSTLSHGFASLPPFLWPVPYAHQTPPMSRSSGYQSTPPSDDSGVLGLPTFSPMNPQLDMYSPFPPPFLSPPSPAFPRWDGYVSSPTVSIPDLSYGLPFPPSAPEEVEAMRREYFGADNSNDLGRFYSTDGYHGPTSAWNGFEA